MIQHEVAKFGFRIRTRSGVVLDHLAIPGRDQADALRKLKQMYPGSEILASPPEPIWKRPNICSFEEVVDLITPPNR
jgi:hypothetical protein